MRPIFINRINKCSYAYLDAAAGTLAAQPLPPSGETGKLHLKSRQVQVEEAAVLFRSLPPFGPLRPMCRIDTGRGWAERKIRLLLLDTIISMRGRDT